MSINEVQNIGRVLLRKPKLAQKPYPPRIGPTVSLPGIKGNQEQRTQMAKSLNDKLFGLINDTYEQKKQAGKKPFIGKKELLTIIKKVIPNVEITMGRVEDPRCAGSVEPMLDINSKTYESLLLKMNRGIKKGNNEDTLKHEMRHVFDYLTQPKIFARYNTVALIGRMKNFTADTNFDHFLFYNSVLYGPKTHKIDKNEIKFLTKKINEHFKELETPADEKIEILQCWRGLLKTESNAYGEEAEFVCKENPEQYLKDNWGDFFFEPKIKLLEKMLKEEIAGERALSAQKYGKKQ